jgi:hypothetical protein
MRISTLLSVSLLVACSAASKRPVGGTCNTAEECASGICGGSTCLDPALDTDTDGLVNGLELSLGSDPTLADSDQDGVADGDELTDALVNVDTDGDGFADILESRVLDTDGDCITDQFDARNDVADSDLSPMRGIVCSTRGLCADQAALMRVDCATGAARCLYDDIPGFEDPETTCDGLDQNCDGRSDEGLPDRDADGLADCVDTDWDNDGVPDATDTCPTVGNADQSDEDGDGVGNACVALYGLAFRDVPGRVTSGLPFSASVELVALEGLDDNENPEDTRSPLPAFQGLVTLTAEGDATLGGPASIEALAGVATFTDLTLDKTGTSTLLVSRSGSLREARSRPIEVVSGVATTLAFDAMPDAVTAGAPFDFALVALDAAGNVAVDYAGTVSFESPNAALALPLAATFAPSDSGIKRFSGATFTTAEPSTLVATDTTGLLGEVAFDVAHGPATGFDVSGPSTAGSGTPFAADITARDAFGNRATSYSGTVRAIASDPRMGLPDPYTIIESDYGNHTFLEITPYSAGPQSIDFLDGTLTGRLDLLVTPGAPRTLSVVSGPIFVIAGEPFSLDVALTDAAGNLVDAGPYSLTANLGDAAPFDVILPSGQATLGPFVLSAAGATPITLTLADLGLTASLNVTVEAAPADRLALALTEPTLPAGVATTVTLTAHDRFGNQAPTYRGTVTFTASDPLATLPPGATFTADDAGLKTLSGVTFRTVGTQHITATDGAGLTGSAELVVGEGNDIVLVITGAPSTQTAGSPFGLSVEAQDTFGNRMTSFRGTVRFSADDPLASLPADYTFTAADQGLRAFSGLALKTAQTVTVRVSDLANPALRTSTTVDITPAAATSLSLACTESAPVAGVAMSCTVTLKDDFGNVARGFAGTVSFSSSDATATLPAPYTFTPSDRGLRSFANVVLKKAGAQTLTATSGALTASQTATVGPAAASKLVVSGLDASVTAGVSKSLGATAFDAFDNVAPFAGSATVTSSDAQAVLPGSVTFSAGTVTFAATFRTAGSQSLTLTAGLLSTSASTTVSPAAGARLSLSALPATVTAGVSQPLVLTVLDAFDNRATGYTGTVNLTSTDGAATLSATSLTLASADQGQKSFTATFATAGTQSVTASNALGSAQRSTTVNPSSNATQLDLAALPASIVAGASRQLTVTLKDQFSNIVSNYVGTVAFAVDAGEAQASISPSSYTFSGTEGGTATITVTFKTAGNRTITATAGSLSDSSSATVSAAEASKLELGPIGAQVAGTAFSVTATLRDTYDNIATGYRGTVKFTTNDTHAAPFTPILPANYTFLAADNGTKTFSNATTLFTAGARTLTVTDATSSAITANASLTLAPAAASKVALTAPATATAGTAFSVTATVSDLYDNIATGYRGTVKFTTNDTHAAPYTPILPANYTFLAADNGTKTFSNATTLFTAGARTLTVTDATTPAITATANVALDPASATAASLSGPASASAGSDFTLTVAMRDLYDNIATGYRGTIKFTTNDSHAAPYTPILPANYTYLAADNGVRTFNKAVTLYTAGARTVSVTDVSAATITGSFSLTLAPGGDDSLRFVTQPASGEVGASLGPTVEILDKYGNRSASNATNVSLKLTANPGRAWLTNASATSSAGLANLASLTLDRPGRNYILQANATNLTSATSAAFDASWAAPTVANVAVAAGASNCVEVSYDVAHPRTTVDIRVEYARADESYATWYPATQSGAGRPSLSTDPYGTSALVVTSAPASRVFRWNALKDLGALEGLTVKVRVTAIAGTASASAESATFAYDASWSGDVLPRAYTAAFVDSTLADLNEDGHLDLVAVAANNDNILFLPGAGDGTFGAPTLLNMALQPAVNPWRLAVADVDADGRPDVVVADRASPRVLIAKTSLLASGTVSIAVTAVASVCNVGDIIEDIAVREVDSDVYAEIHLACPASKKVVRYGFNGSSYVLQSTFTTSAEPYAVAVVDLDWDGAQEVVVGEKGGVVQVFSSGGTESLTLTTTGTIVDLALGDLDRDGLRDLVVAHASVASSPYVGAKSWLALFGRITRNGQGVATSRFDASSETTFALTQAVNQVELADLDRDGWLDLAGTGTAVDNILISRLKNARAGTHVMTSVSTGTTSAGPDALTIGDVNHDGWLDLGASRRTTAAADTNRLVAVVTRPRVDCDTTWTGPSAAPSFVNELSQTLTTDIDRDGRADLVHADGGAFGPGGARIVYGLGNGRFDRNPLALFSAQTPSKGAAVGDLNNDGKRDIAALADNTLRIHTQDTPTKFVSLAHGINVVASRELVVADLDLDRRDDLAFLEVSPTGGTTYLHIYLQLASGVFSAAATTKIDVGSGARGLDVADLDLDGRLDFGFVTTLGTGPNICTLLWTSGTSWETGFGRCSAVTYGGSPLSVSATGGFADLEVGGPVAYLVGVSWQTGVLQVRRPSTLGVYSVVEDDGKATTNPPGYPSCGVIEGIAVGELDGSPDDRDVALRCGNDIYGLVTFARSASGFSGGLAFGDGQGNASLALDDFDGDLREDLVDGTIVYPHSAAATLSFETPDEALVGTGTAFLDLLAAGDFDGNGFLDALGGGVRLAALYPTLQKANGTFEAPFAVTGISAPLSNLAIGDLDGDHRPDIAYGNTATSLNLTLVRQTAGVSTGTSYTSIDMDLGATWPAESRHGVAIGDFDGNGRADVAVLTRGVTTNDNDDRLVIRTQGASGAFSSAITQSADFFFNGTALVASGRLRAVTSTNAREMGLAVAGKCTTGARSCIRIFGLNTSLAGATTLATVASLTPKDTYPFLALEVADLNQDGRDDLVAIQESPTPLVNLWLQTATGDFSEVMTPYTFAADFEDLGLADVDRDGRADLIALLRSSNELGVTDAVEVMLNSSSGASVSFSTASRFEAWGGSGSVLVRLDDVARTGRPGLFGLDAARDTGMLKR